MPRETGAFHQIIGKDTLSSVSGGGIASASSLFVNPQMLEKSIIC
jgi:hypothetical protein